MKITSKENIKEIVEQLDCGFRAFIHKSTGQLLFIPDVNHLIDVDLSPWNEELEQLDNNVTDYFEIEKWSSNEAYENMNDFVNQLMDSNLQSKLLESLRKNKPFQAFKFVIDNSGDYRQHWFDFKNQWINGFVERQLNNLRTNDIMQQLPSAKSQQS